MKLSLSWNGFDQNISNPDNLKWISCDSGKNFDDVFVTTNNKEEKIGAHGSVLMHGSKYLHKFSGVYPQVPLVATILRNYCSWSLSRGLFLGHRQPGQCSIRLKCLVPDLSTLQIRFSPLSAAPTNNTQSQF